MKKVSNLGKLQKECDAMMQEIGCVLFPRSLISGRQTQVMHHLVEKSTSSKLRYDWENLIPLTHQEHEAAHNGQSMKDRIIELKGGKVWFEGLRRKGREIIKVDKQHYINVKEELTKIYNTFNGK